MLVHSYSMRCVSATVYINSNTEQHHQSQYIVYSIGYCLIYLSFPLFGLLADVKTGRYKTIIASIHISFLSWIIGGLAIIVQTYLPESDTLFLIALGIAFLLELIGVGCFYSNIIQFNLDQVIGASADELSAIIYWHAVCMSLSYTIIEIGQCIIEQFFIVTYIMSGMVVSVVLITNYLFKHWLDITPHNVNPVKLIGEVLNYARKKQLSKKS